jgi:hypothetical protein
MSTDPTPQGKLLKHCNYDAQEFERAIGDIENGISLPGFTEKEHHVVVESWDRFQRKTGEHSPTNPKAPAPFAQMPVPEAFRSLNYQDFHTAFVVAARAKNRTTSFCETMAKKRAQRDNRSWLGETTSRMTTDGYEVLLMEGSKHTPAQKQDKQKEKSGENIGRPRTNRAKLGAHGGPARLMIDAQSN